MNWLLRFSLGLPARKADFDEIKKNVPELLDDSQSERPIEQHEIHSFIFPLGMDRIDFGKAIRDWLENAKEQATREIKAADLSSCSLRNCPEKRRKTNQGSNLKDCDDDNIETVELMTVGGGPKKAPLKMFLDIVKRVHRESKVAPQRVILTDPYLYLDVGESGSSGGLNNLFEYLAALGCKDDAEFLLFTTPSPKQTSDSAIEVFERVFKSKFRNASLKRYSPKFSFHDRFYIADHGNGFVRGIFGPSLNGLSSTDIVLIGEIEQINALDKLNKWFSL